MSADMGWSRRIKHCIEHDGFVIACQPIVETASGRTAAYEVLLRMQSDGHIVLPSGFLSSADRSGLIVDIDRWVIRHGLRVLAARRQAGCNASYSFNLSSKSIGDDSILKMITEEFDASGVAPDSVVFEVTETGAIANMSRAATFLNELRRLGVRTALDDFGVGYSTFAYLKNLPVDHVKIDGSFVHGLAQDKLKQAMVRSMNEVAHAMGKLTVAEFVEDSVTLDFLRDIGVDYCQGFYIGQPAMAAAPAARVPALAMAVS
jgi:EAL domain-containing protein (putative c-di-GMP-specific phosphodiesterase class I)